MKKIITGIVLAAASTISLAGTHGPAGCGLGSTVIFKDANEWHEHVLAATTNGTSGNQTFGMTSGTLGCQDAGGPLAADAQQFMDENLDQLAADTAMGTGDSLAALADLIGVSESDRPHFNNTLQANFDSIFESDTLTSGDALDALVAVMSADDALAKYVA